MIKDIFKFKKNSWHMRMMKFIWGYDYSDFRNMCPYFWLSVLNVVIFIPILPIKGIGYIFSPLIKGYKTLGQKIDKACERNLQAWLEDKREKVFTDRALKDNIGRVYNSWDFKKGDQKYRKLLYSLTPEEREKLLNEYNERQEKIRLAKREITLKKAQLNNIKIRSKQEKIARMTNSTKKVFKVVIWPILAGLLYLVGWGGYLLVTEVYWGWLSEAGFILGTTLVAMLSIIMAVYPIVVFSKWVECKVKGACIPCERRKARLRKIGRPFYLLGKGIIWPFTDLIWPFLVAIGKGFKFVWDMGISWKQDNCPGLEWED